MRRPNPLTALMITAALAACGGGDVEDDAGAPPGDAGATAGEAARTVTIRSPAEGDTVAGPSVQVSLGAAGWTVTMAGDTTPNTGHHHLFLDADLSDPSQPIPAEEGRIVHMGDGSSSYTFADVAPGDHTLIAVVGDALHVPVRPLLVDTVRFTVREGAGGR